MRRWVLMVLGLALVGCGDEEEGGLTDDPWRYERTIDEWAKDCPPRQTDVQFYRSDGTPFCPSIDEEPAEFCIRYYGGDGVRAWIDDERAWCEDEEQVIFCSYPSPAHPDHKQTDLLCVSPAEAAARAL